jgi:hypothetical protein
VFFQSNKAVFEKSNKIIKNVRIIYFEYLLNFNIIFY